MTLRRIFIDPPQPARSAAFRYGFLVLVGALLTWNAYLIATRPPGLAGDPYGGVIISVMLLSNHVAAQFRMPPRVTIATRIFSIAWLVFALFHFCYLSRVLYPLR